MSTFAVETNAFQYLCQVLPGKELPVVDILPRTLPESTETPDIECELQVHVDAALKSKPIYPHTKTSLQTYIRMYAILSIIRYYEIYCKLHLQNVTPYVANRKVITKSPSRIIADICNQTPEIHRPLEMPYFIRLCYAHRRSKVSHM